METIQPMTVASKKNFMLSRTKEPELQLELNNRNNIGDTMTLNSHVLVEYLKSVVSKIFKYRVITYALNSDKLTDHRSISYESYLNPFVRVG